MNARLVRAILFLAAVSMTGAVHANGQPLMRQLERAYEVQQLRVIMYEPGSGQVLVSECDACEDKVLKVVAQTKLFKSGKELPLSEVMNYRGREGVVFAGAETDTVTRIKIY